MPVKDPWQPPPVPVSFPLRLPAQDQSLLYPSMGASPMTAQGPSPMQAGPSYQPAAQMPPRVPQGPTGQVSTMDRIFNALGAAGAGFAGRGVSAGPMVELAMQKRQQESQLALQQAQILQHGIQTMHALQPLLMDNPAAVPDIVKRVLMPVFKAGGAGDQATDPEADARLETMLTATIQGTGGMKAEELAQGFPYASAAAQKLALNAYRSGHPEQAISVLRTENDAGRKEATTHLLAGLARGLAGGRKPEELLATLPGDLQEHAYQLIMDADKGTLERAGIPAEAANVIFEKAKQAEAGKIAGGGGPKETPRTMGLTATMATEMQQDPQWAALSGGKPFVEAWQGIPVEKRAELISTAENRINARDITKAQQQGAAIVTMKRDFPVLPEERGKHVLISELLKGNLVAPQAGITEQQLASNKDIASITPQQADKFAMLAPTKQIIDTAKTMSDRLITAKTPQEAFAQGVKLWAGAKTGALPEAAAFVDAMEGYVTNLSRTLGGEKGVLTDKDRAVMKKAAVASLFDTKQAKDLKQAILFDIYKAHHSAVVNEITKTKGPSERSMLDLKIAELDKLNRQTFARSVPAGKVLIQNSQTGQINAITKGNTPPQGWSFLNE